MKQMDSEAIVKAIELILLALFVPGDKPEHAANDYSLQLAQAVAARSVASKGHGCTMFAMQKAGVSSFAVARALRAGVLRAVEVGS